MVKGNGKGDEWWGRKEGNISDYFKRKERKKEYRKYELRIYRKWKKWDEKKDWIDERINRKDERKGEKRWRRKWKIYRNNEEKGRENVEFDRRYNVDVEDWNEW